VASQIHLTLEGLITESTSEGLVSCVLPHVRDQIGTLAKGFQADGAFVGLFTCNQRRREEVRNQ